MHFPNRQAKAGKAGLRPEYPNNSYGNCWRRKNEPAPCGGTVTVEFVPTTRNTCVWSMVQGESRLGVVCRKAPAEDGQVSNRLPPTFWTLMATIPPAGFDTVTCWMESTPPSVPVNPTHAVLPPPMPGIFTVMFVVKVSDVTRSVTLFHQTEPL